MAGESTQRRSARKRATTTRYSDAPATVAHSSPSQPSKRRKTTRAPRTARQADNDDETEHDSSSDIEMAGETAALTELADKMVPFLKEATYEVQVLKQFPARPEDEVVSAFAKIAGRGWTYYVTSASINIGRNPTDRQPEAGVETEAQEAKIHIDLGPSKTISREHSTIYYVAEDEMWHFVVNSRNGAKVNEELVRRHGERALKSGDIIDIGGTEMIFISPNERAQLVPFYLDRMKGTVPPKTDSSRPIPSGEAEPPVLPKLEKTPVHVSPYPRTGQQQVMPESIEATSARPSTPVNTILQAPYLNQSLAATSQFEQMNSMESSEHIDYAADNAKDIKPPMSYATLIGQAILSVPEERLSLNGIYEWIKRNFSYYRYIDPGWQNSIRHNLSLSASFAKRPREANEPGKGGLWYIIEEKKDTFRKEGLKTTSRGGARQSSNPNSPAPNRKSPKKDVPPSDGLTSNIASTPPMPHRRSMVNGTQTPSRPSISISGMDIQQLPQLSQNTPPLPRPQPFLSQNAAIAGSPTGMSSSLYLGEPTTGYSFQTPVPQRAEPRFNVPSTAKLPSQWLPQSSPNLWHIDINNKPFPFDSSPIKGNGGAAPGGLRSSSPPPAIAEGSPTRPKVSSSFPMQPNGDVPQQAEFKAPEAPKHDEEDMPIDLMAGSFTAIGASAST